MLNTGQPDGFKCTACGKCCSGLSEDYAVFLNDDDVHRLAQHFKCSSAEFAQRYCELSVVDVGQISLQLYTLKYTKNGQCVFLGEDNLCEVHEAKPMQCACGPFGLFWHGDRRYECMKDIDVPAEWDQSENTNDFVNGLAEARISDV